MPEKILNGKVVIEKSDKTEFFWQIWWKVFLLHLAGPPTSPFNAKIIISRKTNVSQRRSSRKKKVQKSLTLRKIDSCCWTFRPKLKFFFCFLLFFLLLVVPLTWRVTETTTLKTATTATTLLAVETSSMTVEARLKIKGKVVVLKISLFKRSRVKI